MDDRMLDKVRKLLAKAERTDNEHEAETFTDAAATLMARYGIEAAMLAQEDPGSDLIGRTELRIANPYAVDKIILLQAVAVPMRCRVVMRQDTRSMSHANCRHEATGKARQMCRDEREHSLSWSATLVGYASDRSRVELLFTSLLVQVAHLLAVARPSGDRESVQAYRKSWMSGFSSAIMRRLTAIEYKATHGDDTVTVTPGTAIVVADRNVAVAKATAEAFPHLTAGKTRRLSGSGAGDGHAAGERANLSTGRGLGGSGKAITSG